MKSKANSLKAKPFLKWAGGKTQLLVELEERIPNKIKFTGNIKKYVEPFVGGGSMFFYLKKNYKIEKAYLFDINKDLILAYNVIKNYPAELIKFLSKFEKNYLKKDPDRRKDYYYRKRKEFNEQIKNFNYEKYDYRWIARTAYIIFLNRTCFNGLFRQNRNGEFNVPHAFYKTPNICNAENIIAVNNVLKNTEIICGDFEISERYITKDSFVYLDPPYRPLNKTSSFTDYSKEGFTEGDQRRLSNFYKEMNKRGAFLMLSNSDPTNEKEEDKFFDNLYRGYHIDRVFAKRIINCNATGRGQIRELIITNRGVCELY